MASFVEEQAVRRMLGPDLWKQLCDEFEREAQSVNEVQAGKVRVERTGLSLAVTDSDTTRRLQLRYLDLGPGISIALGNESGTITFRVNVAGMPGRS